MNALATGLKIAPLTRPAPGPVRPAVRPSMSPQPEAASGAGAPPSRADRAAGVLRRHYLSVLGWAFTLFNSVRVAAYLPTAWAIFQSGDSSQHSLWTWCTWFGANLTMALWLRERNGGRFCRAAAVNLGNSSMCGLTLGLILWFRF